MNQGIYLSILFFYLIDFQHVVATHFRGGSISWHALNSTTVEIRYWLAWRYDFRDPGHEHCTEDTHHNHDLLRFGEPLKWKDPTTTDYIDVHDITYVCTDYNPDFGWVAGVGEFILTSSSPEFTLSLQTCCWIRLMNYGPPRNIRLTSGIDLTEYSNVGEINNSPIASTVPLQRVQQQCNAIIKIVASDPDGDDVRCRWASNNERKDDCDEVCGALPAPVELFKRDCVISFEPVDLPPGYHAVTVMVEDFVNRNSRKALSKVPLQFILEVFASDRSCQRPFFVFPTPPDGLCLPTTAGDLISMIIVARNSDPNRPISEIASVGVPLGMTKSAIALVPGSTSDYFVELNWQPPADYTGNHQMCFIAQDHGDSEDSQHYASEQTCVTLSIGGTPVLVDMFHNQTMPKPLQTVAPVNFMWTIMFDHKVRLPLEPAFVTFIDASNTGQVLHTVRVEDSSESTHVMLTPDRYGIALETPELFLQPNAEYIIRVHRGVVESKRRGCGYLLSEPEEWTFYTGDFRIRPGQGGGEDLVALPKAIPECLSSYMVIYVPRELVGDIDPSTMHLDDSSCVGAYHNDSYYSIGSAYGMCNTRVHETEVEGETAYHYENVIHIPSRPYPNDTIITRTHNIEIHVSCVLTNQRPIFAEFDANVTTIVHHIAGVGEFEFALYMCHDDSFTDKFQRSDFPVEVDLRERLYFLARLYTDGDTGIFLKSCRATPTANPLDHIFYEFIKDGCPVDDTTQIHDTPNVKKARFSIESFAFLGHFVGATVFVHCDMSVCMLSDPSCVNICPEQAAEVQTSGPEVQTEAQIEVQTAGPPGTNLQDLPISKRDVSDKVPLLYTNTDGPIRIKADIKGPSNSNEVTEVRGQPLWFTATSMIQISLMTFSLCILIFLLLVLLRVHAILRLGRHRQGQEDHHRPKVLDPVILDMSAFSKQQ